MQERFLDALSENALAALPYLFEFWALPHQVAPEGNWRNWVILGGRGAGKTRAGAEWVRAEVEGATPTAPGRSRRVALVGETLDQAREVMVFGESGILAVSPPDRRPEWLAGRRLLVWPNGATAQVFSAHEPEALRGPQFDAAWVDELGCAAIDKGTNQPHKFLDPKSSESALPAYSNGLRDDLIQMQYLAAMFGYWSDAAKNPVSNVYTGPMIDMSRAHVWAWDARPFPYFPANSDKWGDADNYAHGHWLNGRAANRSLASVVAEICQSAGVTEIDVSALYGLVRGFAEQEPGRARSALQPLMLAYGFEAAERDGKLVFRNRHASPVAELGDDDLVRQDDADGLVSCTREAEAEIWGRLRIGFTEHDGDYEARLEEAALPDETQDNLAMTEMPLVLTKAEARGVAARWLAEARIARDAVSFALPPSARHLGAGDVVALNGSGAGTYRIDRVGMGADQKVEATRIEPGAYAVAEQSEEATALRPFNPVLPMDAVVMDLPLLTGAEADYAPSVAAAARPWPGQVAVFGAASDSNYALMTTINSAAVIGVTETDLAAAAPGRVDRGAALRVRLSGGALQARLLEDVMNGANMAAIGDGTPDNWEVFQFADAQLMATDTYDISTRLRGQAGTDAMGLAWPAGSLFVLLDGGLPQADFGVSARGLTRHLRIGPASRPYSDESYEHIIGAYAGNGLRPLSPVHLRVATTTSGDISLGWVRRGRIDADSWQSVDIPLGEEAELYRVRLFQAGTMLREEFVSAPAWTYDTAMQAADGASGDIDVEIAQVSNTYGPGLPGKVKINV